MRATWNLFEYGIQTEDSDIRAHVSVVNREVYVFQTKLALEAIEEHKNELEIVPAYQPGIEAPTAQGYRMPLKWIPDLRIKSNCRSWNGWDGWKETLTTAQKGKLAVECVADLMSKANFPIWIRPFEVIEPRHKSIQLKGTDLLLFCNQRIQVKCDYKAGPPPRGTGNLYLQTRECNPFKMY